MKHIAKQSVFLALLFVYSIAACAKGKKPKHNHPRLDTITIDFQKRDTLPDLSQIKNIQQGDYYEIIIKNINLNLYKVALQTKDSLLTPPQTTPGFDLLGTDALSGIIGSVSTLVAPVASTTTTLSLAAFTAEYPINYLTKAEKAKMSKKQIKKIAAREYRKKFPVEKKASTKSDEIMDRMKKEIKSINDDYKPRMLSIKSQIDELMDKVTYYQLRTKTEFKSGTQYDALNAAAGTFNVVDVLNAVKKIRADISKMRTDVKGSSSSYNDFTELIANKDAISKDDDLKKTDALIKDDYSKLIVAINAADTVITTSRINDILTNIIYQENNASYTYTSLPIQFKNDQAQVFVNITPANANIPLQTYPLSFVFPVYKKQYVGIAISFYGSNLHNDVYSVLPFLKDTATVDSIVKEKSVSAEFGISALLEYGIKINEGKLGVHVSFGPGVSIGSTLSPRVLFGGGFSYGRRHMFTVNFGGIAGYVDRLSNALNLTTEYTAQPTTITVPQLQVGYFGAIGYLYKF